MGSMGWWHELRTRHSRLAMGGALSVLLVGLAGVTPTAAEATTTWSRVSNPNAGARDNILEGVSCASDTSCTAVGAYLNTSKIDRTLIESSG